MLNLLGFGQHRGFVIRVYVEGLVYDVYDELESYFSTKKIEGSYRTIEPKVYLTSTLKTKQLEERLNKKFGHIAFIREVEPYIFAMSRKEL